MSSSSDDQEYALCGRGYLHVFKTNGSPEVSAAGLQSQAAIIDHTVEEELEEPPPYVIVVHGPSKAGKSLLIKSLAENYPEDVKLYKQGLVTIISGEQRRIQFVECPNHVKGMHDAARYADAVILLIDAHIGFERDTIAFINVLRVHGMPKVMGVLTSLDMFKNVEEQTKTKERIMNFWTGTYEGARLFCLSGLEHGMYLKHEIHDLGSFISQMDFHPLSWRAAKFYVVVDHFEDVTRPERVHMDNRCNRDVVFYGYLRGCDIKKGAKVYINCVGDFPLFSVTSLTDPCPLLASPKRKISRKGKDHDESEGFGPGTYLRLEVRDVPFEFVEEYDPYHPILVGGISPGEENVGYMQRDTAAIDRTVEQPPYVIVVQGTHKVGKSLLIKSLVKHYTKENLNVYMKGPVTIISGEQRRVQFVECPNNINGMLDAAKYADAVILVIDAYIGFEMETFEFVNILRVHGMPKVLGVLTSLDLCKNVEKLSRTKEYLKNYFRTEIYEGAGIFCLSGLDHEMYPEHEILALASFISVMEFHPLSKRAAEPYLLVDRFEDVTHPERVLMDNRCSRDIVLNGYLRGGVIKTQAKVHIAGVGDFPLFGVTSLNDPCPLLASLKRKRYLKGKEQDAYSDFRPGTYLRLEFRDVPFEMVQYIDQHHPILVGGISPGEENVGYMQATLKRHTWHRKLLKTGDPIVVSIGWRRYQTSPIYAMQDGSEQLQMLNYTPVDTQCLAMFWGPLASPNTGVVVVQYPDNKIPDDKVPDNKVPDNKVPDNKDPDNKVPDDKKVPDKKIPDDKEAFRILATGVVAHFNNAAKILKKCKRSGTPWKISGKTALIKDLFRSDHEIDNFINAKLRTKSGIPGKVKKAAKEVFVNRPTRKDGLPREGIAQCSFKHRICVGDTIFMREWKEVEVPRFFKPFSLSDGHEECPKVALFKHETDRGTIVGRRMVSFVEGEPSFQDLTRAKNFELRHCNKEEQKEFKKHPVLVISKEKKMLEKRRKRKIAEENQEEPNKQRSIELRNSRCSRDLYGGAIPTYLKFFCSKRDGLGLTL